MQESSDVLQPHLQRMVDVGVSGLDIIHGELKNLMLMAEQDYLQAEQVEIDNDYSDAMESMDRKYAEGYLDALCYLYKKTYDISFAVAATNPTKDN